MNIAKMSVSFGNLSFAGEGTEEWLTEQLERFFEAVPTLAGAKVVNLLAQEADPGSGDAAETDATFTESLAAHIKAKGGDTVQVTRFLATADWLRRRGAKALTAAAVSKALQENHQKKLGNPADCLNQNVAKGSCEKTKDGFFITPSGLKELGYT
jgi:hypothetical protein